MSLPFFRVKTICNPAESLPRTSRRSSALSNKLICRYFLKAAGLSAVISFASERSIIFAKLSRISFSKIHWMSLRRTIRLLIISRSAEENLAALSSSIFSSSAKNNFIFSTKPKSFLALPVWKKRISCLLSCFSSNAVFSMELSVSSPFKYASGVIFPVKAFFRQELLIFFHNSASSRSSVKSVIFLLGWKVINPAKPQLSWKVITGKKISAGAEALIGFFPIKT